jgi:hypothetical protein
MNHATHDNNSSNSSSAHRAATTAATAGVLSIVGAAIVMGAVIAAIALRQVRCWLLLSAVVVAC